MVLRNISGLLPGDTLQSLGPPPGLFSLPFCSGCSGSLLPTLSNHLNGAGREGRSRLPSHRPPGGEQASKTFLGPRQNSAVNWPPVEGSLGLGWEEGAARARGRQWRWAPATLPSSRTQPCCTASSIQAPQLAPGTPRQWDTLHPGPPCLSSGLLSPCPHRALQRNGALVHGVITLPPSS